MRLPKQIRGILQRIKAVGVKNTLRECLIYVDKYRTFPKWYGKNYSGWKWAFKSMIAFTNACLYYHNDSIEMILNFVPREINDMVGNQVCPISLRPQTENKVLFCDIMKNNDVPVAEYIFWKEENGECLTYNNRGGGGNT